MAAHDPIADVEGLIIARVISSNYALRMNLEECVPKDKYDVAALARARSVGFPELNPVLPALLEWTQDMNWPVAREVVGLIAGAGPAILPLLRSALRSKDSVWKYWLLTELCPILDPPLLAELSEDILRLASDATDEDRTEEVDLAAAALIKSS